MSEYLEISEIWPVWNDKYTEVKHKLMSVPEYNVNKSSPKQYTSSKAASNCIFLLYFPLKVTEHRTFTELTLRLFHPINLRK